MPEAQYTVVKGDTLAKIAKAHGVTLKALEDANPGVVPTKLKINQKLTLPAGGAAAPAAMGTSAGADMPGTSTGGEETYKVKSGDTLAKIAKAHGVTLKALEAANPGVDPNHIKVGLKLNLPVKAGAAAPVETARACHAVCSAGRTGRPGRRAGRTLVANPCAAGI